MKIQNMLDLQKKLNDSTNGEGWEEGVSPKNGKIIDWNRAIWLECAEGAESFPWKHWKDVAAEPDMENARIETVDIWHFILSEMISISENPSKEIRKALKKVSSTEKKNPIQAFEKMAFQALKLQKRKGKISSYLKVFFELMYSVELDFDSLYKLYMMKNVLNEIRQENGYQEGTYVKVFIVPDISNEMIEDNVIMKYILDNNPDFEADKLKDAFMLLYEEYSVR